MLFEDEGGAVGVWDSTNGNERQHANNTSAVTKRLFGEIIALILAERSFGDRLGIHGQPGRLAFGGHRG